MSCIPIQIPQNPLLNNCILYILKCNHQQSKSDQKTHCCNYFERIHIIA